jgi:hypothetical protein
MFTASIALAEANSCKWGDEKPATRFWFRLITNQFCIVVAECVRLSSVDGTMARGLRR